jgi:CRP-like cAMP-binding protein
LESTGNRLLDCLSEPLAAELIAASRVIDLPIRTTLGKAGETPAYGYFMTKGAASIVVVMAEGGSSEVGMVGNEGLIGASALLGSSAIEAGTSIHAEGKGLRIPMKLLRTMFDDSTELRQRILQYLQCQINTTGQISACNRLHEAEERLARWLLTAADVTQSESLEMTQEFLAQVLGSQRTTVALVAGHLQHSGLIQYSRGKVRILNREGLKAAACDCYRVTHKAVSQLYVCPLQPALPTPTYGTSLDTRW